MNLLQITASVPGKGEVPILLSPSLADATRILTGAGEDANGSVSTTFGAAILAPWAGRLTGSPTSSSSTLESVWEGERISFPAGASGRHDLHDGADAGQAGRQHQHGHDSGRTGCDRGLPRGLVFGLVALDDGDYGSDGTGGAHAGPDGDGAEYGAGSDARRRRLASGLCAAPAIASDVRIVIPSITKVDIDRRTNLPSGKTVLDGRDDSRPDPGSRNAAG